MRISRKARSELKWILLFIATVPLLYLLVFGDGGYLQLRSYREELRQLQLQNEQLQQRERELLRQIEHLKKDPQEIERVARERYNFARPGDIIINVPPAE